MRYLLLATLALACAPRAKTATTGPSLTPPPSRPENPVEKWAQGAQLFDNLGDHHRAVTTTSKEAQAWFDQGLRLTYGFNHDEATRSFARAAMIDPECAACYWGVALTLGPNYNVPMLPDRAATAWAAVQKARALAPKAGPVEQSLIGALIKRYKGPEPLEPPAQQPFTEAYAQEMRVVAAKYPDDLDVQVLFAESLMDVNPWKLWALDGKPAPGTDEILKALEGVLAKNPNHPGANHYYIHAIEASNNPGKALPSADRLAGLMPGAGHVVHMPAHIYQRVGRYSDASQANRKAAGVDLDYMKKTKPPGYYPMYLGHNYGFLAFSSSMEGRGEESLKASREAVKAMPPEMLNMMPGMDFFVSEPLLVMVRFAKWNELLAEPRPDAKYSIMTALWLHAHGMALAATGKPDDAAKDRAEILQLREKLPPELMASLNPARELVMVAAKILEARIAEARKKPEAIALYTEAVKLEDQLAYSEPADWFYPTRHFLGAALLDAKKAREAEAVYREDLKRNPGNGWALFGLAQALKAQKKSAAAVEKDFQKAWQNADVKLTKSIL